MPENKRNIAGIASAAALAIAAVYFAVSLVSLLRPYEAGTAVSAKASGSYSVPEKSAAVKKSASGYGAIDGSVFGIDKPVPDASEAAREHEPSLDLELLGTVASGGTYTAMVKDKRANRVFLMLKEGDPIQDGKVVKIGSGEIKVKRQGLEYIFKMK